MMTGSNRSVSVMAWSPSGRYRLRRADRRAVEVDQEQALDLRQDLGVAEPRAADRAGRAGGHAGAAALAQRRVDLGDHPIFVEEDGVEGALVVADAAAGT